MTKPRTIYFLTGIRSEYDILAPVIEAVAATSGLEPSVIVTGAHLSAAHGMSVRQIEADGHRIAARIQSLPETDDLAGRVKGAAVQLLALSELIERERPDMLVVMGDREESITGGLAAAYHHIPLVHIGGGDHAADGNVDNSIRHAVTKLAHLHMTASKRSAERVLGLGEAPWRVHATGAPGLDRLVSTPHLDRAAVLAALGADWGDEPYVLLIYHPTITDHADAEANMRMVLRNVAAVGQPILIIHPNSDPGSHGVIASIEDFVAAGHRAKAFAYLPRDVFVNAMRHAGVMVGNSSAGVLEAPTLKLPAVNIGERQRGRESSNNVIFVDYDDAEIQSAVRHCLFDGAFREAVESGASPYGDGTAGRQIATILADVELGPRLMNKEITV